jgi:hypothetical protein
MCIPPSFARVGVPGFTKHFPKQLFLAGIRIAVIPGMKHSPLSRSFARTYASLGVAMAEIDFAPKGSFSYRHNQDGTIDSICLDCFLTAATGSKEQELTGQESLHLTQCLGKNCSGLVKPEGLIGDLRSA